MDNVPKFLKILNIPLKILLPSVCVFTGLILFLPEKVLNKLYLYEWKNENGFVLGLFFIISLTLILIYVLYFVIKFVRRKVNLIFRKRRSFKSLKELNGVELSIIAYVYSSPNYTSVFDYNQPIIKGLLERGYLYTGSQQLVYDYIEGIKLNVMLMPNIIECLDYYLPKLKNEIVELRKKLNDEKDINKQNKIKENLENLEDWYESFTTHKGEE